MTDIGANAKMNEFCAIMGLLNLKYIESAMEDRRRVYEAYTNALVGVEGIRRLKQNGYGKQGENQGTSYPVSDNFAYFPIVIEEAYPLTRNQLYESFAEKGIHVRKYFYPLTSDQACFKNRYKKVELPVARALSERMLTLPIYEGLENADVERIIRILSNVR